MLLEKSEILILKSAIVTGCQRYEDSQSAAPRQWTGQPLHLAV